MKEVNLSPSDVVGAVERGIKELAMYLNNNAPLLMNVEEIRKHFKHMDEHLGRLREMQLLSEATNKAANDNAKDPAAGIRVN